MAEHDGSYHALGNCSRHCPTSSIHGVVFSHPELVEDLLRYFVPEALIGELNFSGMQRVAENCSCIFCIHAVHGVKRQVPRRGT